MRSSSSPSAPCTTASGLPRKRAAVKTSTWVNSKRLIAVPARRAKPPAGSRPVAEDRATPRRARRRRARSPRRRASRTRAASVLWRGAPAKNGAPGTKATPRSTASGEQRLAVDAFGQLDPEEHPAARHAPATSERAARRQVRGERGLHRIALRVDSGRGSSARARRGSRRGSTSWTMRWLNPGVCRSAACLAWTSLAKTAGGAIT